MRKLIYFIVLFFIIFFGCNHGKTYEYRNAEEKMELSFRILPEGNNSYCIEWEDTLGFSQGYIKDSMNFIKRPKELWCVVTNLNDDTLGYYRGSSMAQTFTCFGTTDSIVNLNFMIGLNFFSDQFDNSVSDADKESLFNTIVRFKPLEINLKESLGKENEIILE